MTNTPSSRRAGRGLLVVLVALAAAAAVTPALVGASPAEAPVTGADAESPDENESRTGSDPPDETADDRAVITADRLADRGPAVAGGDGEYVLVWSHEPAAADAGRQVRFATRRGETWVEAGAVTEGIAHDSQPAVAVTEDGRAMAVWTRVAGLGPDASAADAMNATEVYYAVRSGGEWSTPRSLTTDDRMDVAPRVVAHDGGFTVVWSSVRGTTADGTFVVEHARVEGTGPDAVGPVRSRAVSRVPVRVAAGEAVRVAYLDPTTATGDGNGSLVTLAREEGRLRERARYDVRGLRSLSVGPEGVAWVAETDGDAGVHYGTDGRREAVPSRLNVSAVGGVRLAWGDGFPMVAYRAVPENASSRRLVYATRQGGRWVAENVVGGTAAGDLSYFETTVAAGDAGFVAAFTGREPASPEQNRDVFAVAHEFRPDLTVDAELDGETTAGNRTALSVTVRNRGERAAEPVRVAVRGGETRATRTVGRLGPGASRSVTLSVTAPDTGRLRVVADPGDRLAELSETNNATRVLTARPDAAVTAVETALTPGDDTARVTATVRNGGRAVATGVSVALTDDRGTVDARRVGRLAPGETRTVSLSTPLARLDTPETTVRVDAAADADAINDSLLVRGLRPDLRVLAPDVRFQAAGDAVLATVRVTNRGPARGTFPVRVRHEGTVVAAGTVTLSRGVPDADTARLSVRLPARLSGETVTVVAAAPADRARTDNAVTVTVPSLSGVDTSPPTVENFTATTADGAVVVRWTSDERLNRSATRVVVRGPNGRHTLSGTDVVRRGPGFTYLVRVEPGAAGSYEATLAAAADGAGNEVTTSPSAVTSVDGGTGGLGLVSVGGLVVLGLGVVVAYRRLS